MTRHLFVFGYGYSAERVGALLLGAGWRVTGTTRSGRGADRLRSLGVEPCVFTGDVPVEAVDEALASATHVLDSIPPARTADPDGAVPAGHVHEDALRGAAAAGVLRWLGLLSTAGVYGDTGGEWVDESSPLRPKTDRARRRVAVERWWRALAHACGVPLQIFRLPGIYGPGRSPLDRVRTPGVRRIFKEGSISNRIHVDDIAGAVVAGVGRPEVTGPINVTDDLPAPGHEVLAGAAELLGLPIPPAVPYEEAELGPVARSFYEEDRRIRNDRLKSELGYRLKVPDWKAGLRALVDL